MPGHRIGDVVSFGGRDDDPCSCAVQEVDSQGAIAAGSAGCQDGLITMDFHLSVGQRRQVAVVEHLDFYLHLCENTKRERPESFHAAGTINRVTANHSTHKCFIVSCFVHHKVPTFLP